MATATAIREPEVLPANDVQPMTSMLPATMIEKAIASGAGIEVMERLLDMQAKWEERQAKKAFNAAMAQLREHLPTIVKNQKVDFTSARGRTNYQYEDLSDVTEALAPVMSRFGLTFKWNTQNVPGGVRVTCVIIHADGHSEDTALEGPIDNSGNKNPMQQLGSAVTYLQRYTLKAAIGVAASKDDDGNASGRRPDEPIEQGQHDQRQAPTDPKEILARLQAANRKLSTLDEFGKFWSTDSVRTAANSLPPDWKVSLGHEKNAKEAELKAAAQPQDNDPFPGDLPSGEA